MGRTVWYPGHMAKGKRQLEALANNLDIIIEVRDARAPYTSSSPLLKLFLPKIQVMVVLSKADLANEKTTRDWCLHLKEHGLPTWSLDLRKSGISQLRKAMLAKKPAFRDLRLAVVGTPNVGKSMLINQFAGRRAAPVGGIPGITKGVSWFRGDGFMLVDSPGILDPHSDTRVHRFLSWIGSSRGQVIGSWEEHAKECISFMVKRSLWPSVESTWNVPVGDTPNETLENIGRRLGKLLPGGVVDMESAGRLFMDAIATGKYGRMSFEKPDGPSVLESL